jgi:hypothetical protein
MAKGMGLTALIVAVVLLHQTCTTTTTTEDHCPPSSCGSILNISYPFRLTSDPENCGDRRYDLSCENNQTLVLYLYHGRYYVRQINYSNYSIQVGDTGIGLNANEYSFNIPHYLLDFKNFSDRDPYQTYAIRMNTYLLQIDLMYFVKCEKPINSQYYLNISACFEGGVYSSKRYRYALFSYNSAVELGDLCQVEQISLTDRYYYYEDLINISCIDFHNNLLRGFDLYWNRVYCGSCRVGDCYIDEANNVGCHQVGAYIKECMQKKDNTYTCNF